MLKTYTIPEIPACQLILNLYNCATALQIISEYDGVTGDSILDLPVSGNVISILDEVISKLEMGDSVSVSANLLNVTWFVEKCLLISNVFFTSKTITSLKCCAIFDFVGLQSEVITRLAGLCTTFSDIQKGATRLNHVSNQVFCRIAEQLGHGRSLGRTQYEELLLAQKNFSIIFDDLMELFENDNQNDGSSQKIIKLETSLETIRLKFESFLNVEMELQAKPVSLWTLSAENLKSKVNRVDHLQKSLSLLETKYAVEKQKFDEKLGADMLKVEFLERKLDSVDIVRGNLIF